MWSKLRETVVGLAEQAGIEVPGLDSAATAVTDAATSVGETVSGVVADVAASDVVGSVTDLAGEAVPTDLVAGATDAAASTGEAVAGVAGEAASDAGGLVESIKGRLAP